MNPNLISDPFLKQLNLGSKPYVFDSEFESGNLDMVI